MSSKKPKRRKPKKPRDYVTLGELVHQKGGPHRSKKHPARRANQTRRWQQETP